MTGKLSRGPARWKYSIGEDADYLQIDEKTLEALLQLYIGYMFLVRRIGGRGYVQGFGFVILVSEIPLSKNVYSNQNGKNGLRQYMAGSFTGAVSS